MNPNLPNPFDLNEEDLADCKKMMTYMSPHVVGRSFAKSLTVATWLMIMLFDLSLDAEASKSKSDVIRLNKRLFDAIAERYKK